MHRTYVNNAYNRIVGRVGMAHGTAVISSSGGGGGGKSSYSSGGGDLGYSSTSYSSYFSGGSSSGRSYVDNSMNRFLGRVGLPHGSAIHSSVNTSTGGNRTSLTSTFTDAQVYSNSSYNRRLGRVGLPLGSAVVIRSTRSGGVTGNNYRVGGSTAVPDWGRERQIIPFESLELGDKLGGGGFGDVHTAFLDRKIVAMKRWRVQRVSQEEFQAEDDFSLQLNHEAIVKIFGACTVSPYLAIGMEFMAGGSLYDILHVEQCILTTSQQEQMLADCLEAMKYLHRRNVTHRDIKSMSIMICDDFEHCKLGDFGLALKEEAQPERKPTARTFLSKWEELKLARSLNRMSIVDVNTSNEACISEKNNGGLPSYLADVRNTSSLTSLSSRSSSSHSLTSTSSGSRNSSSSSRLSSLSRCYHVYLENRKYIRIRLLDVDISYARRAFHYLLYVLSLSVVDRFRIQFDFMFINC